MFEGDKNAGRIHSRTCPSPPQSLRQKANAFPLPQSSLIQWKEKRVLGDNAGETKKLIVSQQQQTHRRARFGRDSGIVVGSDGLVEGLSRDFDMRRSSIKARTTLCVALLGGEMIYVKVSP